MQVSALVRGAQGSTEAHTAAGQSASGGQATAVQAQAEPAPWQALAVVKLAQGSATVAAASGCWFVWGVRDA